MPKLADWTPAPPDADIQLIAAKLSEVGLHRHDWLSAQERTRMQSLQRAEVARRYLASRILLRAVLGGCLGVPGGSLLFEVAEGGKPHLRDMPLQFNLSHSGDFALLAVSRNIPVGIDLELFRSRPKALQLAERVMPEADCQLLASMPPETREHEFFRRWTGFEARQKAFGQGVFAKKQPRESAGGCAIALKFDADRKEFHSADDLTQFLPQPRVVLMQAALAWQLLDDAPKICMNSFNDLKIR